VSQALSNQGFTQTRKARKEKPQSSRHRFFSNRGKSFQPVIDFAASNGE